MTEEKKDSVPAGGETGQEPKASEPAGKPVEGGEAGLEPKTSETAGLPVEGEASVPVGGSEAPAKGAEPAEPVKGEEAPLVAAKPSSDEASAEPAPAGGEPAKAADAGGGSAAADGDAEAEAKARAAAEAREARAAARAARAAAAGAAGDGAPAGGDAEAKAKAAEEARAARAAARAAKAAEDAAPAEPKAPSPNQPRLDRVVELLKEAVGAEAVAEAYINEKDGDCPTLVMAPEHWVAAAGLLKTHEELRQNYLRNVTGTDMETHLEVVYHLISLETKQEYCVKVKTDRDQPSVPSVTPVWATANWNEREIYDLLGVDFPGHPDLRRIMMPDDWVGYPLRKDYEPIDPEV
ncbi:NADH-quinone oxidoreductase subunit C [Paenibacillus aurantius]|uniref:NADH-quinone oxidoreductase subunit C n=1 Tax=Paenibacillus aurantius TaxID=2918900 RepID=A0AA96RFK2_9BACL|nr:NADH-quinone oxidoreductase subunit C [Paenibacillus aurantius]WNQ11561.1 NADH-quinone oxidoreductase subunit C [Paenibacillus aurantius]